MFLSSSISPTITSRNMRRMMTVKASVSPEVSGLRKRMLEVLKACSAPSSPRNSSTPRARNATERRLGSLRNRMPRL